jgi:hypothetical protein
MPAPPESGLLALGLGFMLRVTGAAPLFSKVRVPRLPMPDDEPPYELPARASARLGASTRAMQKNRGNRMRH